MEADENIATPLTGDSFPNFIVRHDIRKKWYDESEVIGYQHH